MNIIKFFKLIFNRIFGIVEEVNTAPRILNELPQINVGENFIGPSSYKKSIDLVIPKLQGNTTPTPDPVFSLFEFVGTKLLTGLGAAAWNTFYTEVVNKGVTELTQILANLEEINKKLDEMMKLYVNSTYEKYINERSNYVSALVNAQKYYYQQLVSYDPEDSQTLKVLDNWSTTNISGNSAMVQWQNFIDFVLNTKINTNTLYNIYDAYVYNTIPFEHLGYDYREQLRDADFAAIVTNAILCILYIKQNKDITDSVREIQLNSISDKLKQYYDYYDAHKVVRREDMVICQIERTHFEMKKELWFKDFKNHSWFKNGTTWDSENQESSWCLLWGDDIGTIPGVNCGKQLYKAEINRIKNYYCGSGKSLWDILFNEMKLTIPIYTWGQMPDKIRIPLSTWVSDSPSDSKHRKQSFGEVIQKSTDDINKEYVGTVQIEHTGFLWLIDTFRGWSDYDDNKKWLFMTVTSRDKDNYKD